MTPQTELLRQVHPSFVSVLSQAFTPFPKDKGELSVYYGDGIAPVASHSHYTQYLGLKSAGVLAVTVSECEQVGLETRPDTLDDNPHHAVIDFNPLPEKSRRKAASKHLTIKAEARGWLYRPT